MSEGNSFFEQFAYKQSLKSSGWFEDITYNTTYGFTTTPTKHISAFFYRSQLTQLTTAFLQPMAVFSQLNQTSLEL